MAEQSQGAALLAEFKGEKIAGQVLIMLSVRIDGLISIATGTERNRCFDIIHRAVNDAEGAILEMDTR